MTTERHRPRILLATDFDGTAATVIPPATHATWHPLARSTFADFAQREEVALAIISGRALLDLYTCTSGLRCYRGGSFGAEIDTPTGAILDRIVAPNVRVPDRLVRDCARAGVTIERKPHGAALHWRSAGIAREHPTTTRFTEWATRAELAILESRGVLEAVRPGIDKLTALRRIAAHVQTPVVIFAGDDVPDVGAATWAATQGFGFFVLRDDLDQAPPGCVALSSPAELWTVVRETVVSLLRNQG